MARYLIEVHLPSETRAEFARLLRVIRGSTPASKEARVGTIGLVSSGQCTYCVVQAKSAGPVDRLMQTAMLTGRVLRITELDSKRG
jgi:hypothetical protein